MALDGTGLARATHFSRRTPLVAGQLRRDPRKPDRIVYVLAVPAAYTCIPPIAARGSNPDVLRALAARRQARVLVQALPTSDRTPPRVTRAAISMECWPVVRLTDLTPDQREALTRLTEGT